ncbi:hypothetical protein PBI_KRATIO_68 [Mycobacterium phage Kratio]|uniref:Uncharacterized protein n=1 Tax=Mycobacterium phage Kratio TaxID=1606763 RepID=A0A0C5ADQ1_9CAUD|nr:hypothetical protein PBI_KRATIO_68 [Mycobacterium phage Kratio]AJK27397.1 hypothetical protein PBI_KRATIO_68 [Mycobacterium phage Kratio]
MTANTRLTGRETVEAIAAEMGWTSHRDEYNPLVWDFRKPNSKRRVHVYFGLRGQVIEATTTTASHTRHVLGANKSGQVRDFIAETAGPTAREALAACHRAQAAQHGRARNTAEKSARRVLAALLGADYAAHRSIDYYAGQLEELA